MKKALSHRSLARLRDSTCSFVSYDVCQSALILSYLILSYLILSYLFTNRINSIHGNSFICIHPFLLKLHWQISLLLTIFSAILVLQYPPDPSALLWYFPGFRSEPLPYQWLSARELLFQWHFAGSGIHPPTGLLPAGAYQ